jgi:hypothetical protein
MKNNIVITAMLVLLISVGAVNTASGLGTWVEFCNPRISYLNDDLYSFKVDVNWGGDIYTDPETGLDVDPILDRLWISNNLGAAVSWTGNHSGAYGYSYAGDWYGGIESPSLMGEFGLHGPEFGWDFIPDAPMQSSYTMNFTAFAAWLDYDYVYMKQVEGGNEVHSGSFDVMVIPEPASLILLGLGMVCVSVVKRRR